MHVPFLITPNDDRLRTFLIFRMSMNTNKGKKWFKRIVIAVLILIFVLFIGTYILLKEAFGSKYRKIKMVLSETQTLVGYETYNADMAAVFYDVDFELETKTDTLVLGSGTFSHEDWQKSIKLHEIADWFVLPVSDGSYSKLLLKNKLSRRNIDTTFSPLDLRYDNLWKTRYDEIPYWVNFGSSEIDSIANDKIYVTYTYRIGDYEPFKYYTQTIEYKIDSVNGNVKTKYVYERKEINNSR